MIAFEVWMNDQKLCTAGIGADGVLSTVLNLVQNGNGERDCELRVGGLLSAANEFVTWTTREVAAGDEIRIKVAECERVDVPPIREQHDPASDL